MKHIIIFIISLPLITLLTAPNAFSQTQFSRTFASDDWVMIMPPPAGNFTFIQKKCMRTASPSQVEAWVRTFRASDTFKGHTYKNVINNELYLFDFDDNSYELKSTITYSQTGKILDSFQFADYQLFWHNVIPGSVAEEILEKARLLFMNTSPDVPDIKMQKNQ